MPTATSDSTASNNLHALLPFLQTQSQNTLTRLYQRPSSCLAIFRLLGAIERQLIMNLLWLESVVPTDMMASWVVKDKRKTYNAALQVLASLHIIPASNTRLSLNATFKSAFRQAITGGGDTGSFGVPVDPSSTSPSASEIKSIDAFALQRWETILHYMVSSGTSQALSRPSKAVLHLLETSGLMGGNPGMLRITSSGFQFLLESPHSQLWIFLLHYLAGLDQRPGMDLVEVLSLIFMLSTTQLGRAYSISNLSPTQKTVIADLQDYGLIWQPPSILDRFSPTRLATTLTSSAPPLPTADGSPDSASATKNSSALSINPLDSAAGAQGASQQGFIVLETNYRVYAYTDNALQTAVLNLFVTLKYRFPNLVVGSITRESVKKALSNGISADQIISYLNTHAHPQMRKNNPLLPVTVQDQIRLWELERNRLKSQEGYLYTDFTSQGDYEFLLNYAKQLNVVVWENATKRCFFGTAEGHQNIKTFIERRAGNNTAG